jgi:phage shock protein C
MVQARLTRSTTDRMIAGVCGGLGQYFGVDPVIVRLIFVVLAFTTFLTPLIYPVLWLIMPESGTAPVVLPPDARYDPLTGEPLPPRSAEGAAHTAESQAPAAAPSGRNRALGLLLLGVGAIVLLNTIGDMLSRLLGLDLSNVLFPLLLVGLGVYLLRKS